MSCEEEKVLHPVPERPDVYEVVGGLRFMRFTKIFPPESARSYSTKFQGSAFAARSHIHAPFIGARRPELSDASCKEKVKNNIHHVYIEEIKRVRRLTVTHTRVSLYEILL